MFRLNRVFPATGVPSLFRSLLGGIYLLCYILGALLCQILQKF